MSNELSNTDARQKFPVGRGPVTTALFSGMAGGLAWGIRGQYGHETGAMIAGILIGFTLVCLHGQRLSALASARAVAMLALGISVGGSMTYGQTVGLTQDAPLVGNAEAYWWGMLGLAIKGGVWFGLGAALFGMALSSRDYHPIEWPILFALMLGAFFAGMYFLNSPFDPANRELPTLYFSDHWHWEPDVDKPRREQWGGLVSALVVLLVYLSTVKRDWMATSMTVFGLVGGALGFPAGQSIQSYNSWHGEWIRSLPTSAITNHFNWWNMMETTFGFVAGAFVGLGVWVFRNSIHPDGQSKRDDDNVWLNPNAEWILVVLHVAALVCWNFGSVWWVDFFADVALTMIIVPVIAVMGGRYWPFLVSLPIVMIPIAGKSLRQLVYREPPELATWPIVGWPLYLILPLVITTVLALHFARAARQSGGRQETESTTPKPKSFARRFQAVGLFATTWLYFGLNYAFFHFPLPWKEWSGRTPNAILFFVFAIGLTILAARRASNPSLNQ